MNMEQIIWSPGVTLEAIEKQVILKAFRFYRGHHPTAAVSLGISERTLRTKLTEYEAYDKRQLEIEEQERKERGIQLLRARGLAGTTASPTEGVIFGTGAGIYVEPAVEAPAQPAVPVPEPKEVQSVLPAKAAAGRKQSGR